MSPTDAPASAGGPRSPRVAVVLLAAGSGTRVGAATNKVLLPLRGRPVLAWSLTAARSLPGLARLVVVHRPEDREAVQTVVAGEPGEPGEVEVELVEGGASRHASEWRALLMLADAVDAGEVEVVAVHDAARPLAGTALFGEAVRVAAEHGGAVPMLPRPGLVARTSEPGDRPLQGRTLAVVQTPQAFRAQPLLSAYRHAAETGFEGTDTAACLEHAQRGGPAEHSEHSQVVLRAIPGSSRNLKVTYAADLPLADRLLE